MCYYAGSAAMRHGSSLLIQFTGQPARHYDAGYLRGFTPHRFFSFIHHCALDLMFGYAFNTFWLSVHRGTLHWSRDGDVTRALTVEQFTCLTADVDWQRLSAGPLQAWIAERWSYVQAANCQNYASRKFRQLWHKTPYCASLQLRRFTLKAYARSGDQR